MKSLSYVLIGLAVAGLALFACGNVAQAYVLGPNYVSATATASTWFPHSGGLPNRGPQYTVDGIERNTTIPDWNGTNGGMWLGSGPTETPPGGVTGWIKLDLGSSLALASMDVYNYNESAVVNRGVATMDVSHSTDDSTYTLLGNYGVSIGPGVSTPWGPSLVVNLGNVSARYVLLDNFTSHGNPVVMGLNEVEIYGIPEPSTVALLLMGLVGLAVVAWRRRNR